MEFTGVFYRYHNDTLIKSNRKRRDAGLFIRGLKKLYTFHLKIAVNCDIIDRHQISGKDLSKNAE